MVTFAHWMENVSQEIFCTKQKSQRTSIITGEKGVTEPEWKKRLGNHKKSFEDKKYSDDTELSKEVWRIKKKRRNFSVKWRILKQHRAYDPVSRRCVLCLKEKLAILEHDGANLLNKRSEIIGTCRHRRKYMLSSYDVK